MKTRNRFAVSRSTKGADAAGSADTRTAEQQLSELKDHVVTDEGESLLTAALDMGINDFSIVVRLRFGGTGGDRMKTRQIDRPFEGGEPPPQNDGAGETIRSRRV